ncbi:DNA-binding protein [Pseudarthrobacter sp. J75]|uniref:helix-turn-helix transcriptional regulator n=1 Tax=Pseudarthrobacter sp. J75 TaxID=3116486 RepID=UPI002E7FD7ED|nr:DNA-binding protein [Pseudarthrobacter sp. J75]MEE2529156.1 DNA-binding protein [Pseudarthrobacter sp. J75]
MAMTEELVSPVALAEYLGTTTGALAQMRYRGIGPKFIKLGAKAVRYSMSDVNAWLAANTMQCTSEKATA